MGGKLSAETNQLGKLSSCMDVVEKYNTPKLNGKVAIVTGGNSGIGLETCKTLSYLGCRVILCSRSKDRALKALKEYEIDGEGGFIADTSKVTIMELDLANLDSVKKFCDEINKDKSIKNIDYLVLNAGIMAVPKLERTKQGFESQMGTNYFGHYYLTELLWNKISKQKVSTRVIVLSSIAHTYPKSFDVDNMLYENDRVYSAWGAYGESKLANVLHAKMLAERCKNDKKLSHINVYSVHPGVIYTGLTQNLNFIADILYKYLASNKNITQGASSTVYACLATEIENEENNGVYIYDCAVQNSQPLSYDVELREKLETKTREILDMKINK